MARELLEFRLSDGSKVLFETAPSGSHGLQRAGRFDDGVKKVTETLETVAERIRPAAEVVLNALRKMDTPQEIELEFGIAFTAAADVIFTSAQSEVSFTVRLKWEKAHGRQPQS